MKVSLFNEKYSQIHYLGRFARIDTKFGPLCPVQYTVLCFLRNGRFQIKSSLEIHIEKSIFQGLARARAVPCRKKWLLGLRIFRFGEISP
jgi:hypothetical protein